MDVFQTIEVPNLTLERVKYHLERISAAQAQSGDLGTAVSAAVREFNDFFLNYGKPYFKENKFIEGIGNPISKEYNETLETLLFDLQRLYNMAESSAKTTVSAYNYSSITAEEIKNLVAQASSKVLDLKILNDFVKGTAIVAGDDFVDQSKIDTTIQAETSQAEVVEGASSIGLKAVGIDQVSNKDNTTITITPIAPTISSSEGESVNTDPTPGNVQRFYEGHFYAPMGEQRPEGGTLQFKYIVSPAAIPPAIVKSTTINGKVIEDEGVAAAKTSVENKVGFYAIVASTEESLQKTRLKMLDGNPDTFWEAEYVYKVPSLLPTLEETSVAVSTTVNGIEDATTGGEEVSLSIDIKSAENAAKEFDFNGRDLILHIDYEFDIPTPINFVIIDPVLFHTSSFIEVTDISIAAENEEYKTVDGFHEQSFDKILTPEANKVVNNDIVKKTFAPSNFAYQGLGVFSFPIRIGNKIRITLLMRDPVPVLYERMHILTQEVTTKTVGTTQKGVGGLF